MVLRIIFIIVGCLVAVVAVATVLGVLLSNSNKKSESLNVRNRVLITACIDNTDLEEENTNSTENNDCKVKSINSSVYLDYSLVGYTDTNGSISIQLANLTSNHSLHIIDRVNGYGYTQFMAPLATQFSSYYLSEQYTEPILTNVNGIDVDDYIHNYNFFVPISYNWSDFNVYFHYYNNSKESISIRQLRSIQVYSSLFPATTYELAALFEFNSSNQLTIKAVNASYLKNLINNMLPKHGAIKFTFYVDLNLNNNNDDDYIYYQTCTLDFYLTQFKLNGYIHLLNQSSLVLFDPSLTDLKLTSLTNPNLIFNNIHVNKTGYFETSQQLPIGTYAFEATNALSSENNNNNNKQQEILTANGNVLLSRNLFLNITLLTFNESLNSGGSSFTVSNSFRSINANLLRLRRTIQSNRTQTNRIIQLGEENNKISVSVVSGAQNAVQTNLKSITTGTTSTSSKAKLARLTYQVASIEYPYYVNKQSIFNDLWSLNVYTSQGDLLYSMSKDVNSMLFSEPIWLATGTTGLINRDINLEAIPAAASTIYLKVTSVNIGDSKLPTSVSASLTIDTCDLTIKSIQVTDFVKCLSRSNPNPCFKTKNSMSIPPAGEKNIYEKYVLVKYEAAEQEIKIAKVDVFFLPQGSTSPIQIYTSTIDNNRVKQIDATQLKIRISFDQANPINFERFNKFNVKIVLTYLKEGVEKTCEKISDEKITALWQAPFYADSSRRYSTPRDKGGDGWACVRMYNWMLTTSLLTRYNDISGEHSRDLGHSTHENGNHIDIFHYYTIDSSSGTNNFAAFIKAVLAKDLNKVKGWIEIHRTRFDQLNSDSEVIEFITHSGKDKWDNNPKFTSNWLRFLFETGKSEELDLDLNLDEWKSPAKLNWEKPQRIEHSHHIHIRIRD